MENPKVSVCLPTYNRARLVFKTIKSILAQTYMDFELIIGDDASTDDTRDVVKKFQDRRIIYYKNKTNFGLWSNCNKLLDLAKGEYVIFPGDDDILMENLLKEEVRILDKFHNIGFVAPHVHNIDLNENIIYTSKSNFDQTKDYYTVPGQQFLNFFLRGKAIFNKYHITWTWPSVMMRKDLILKCGKFNLDLDTTRGDSWLLYRFSLLSDFAQIPKPLFKFRYYNYSINKGRYSMPLRKLSGVKGIAFDESIWLLEETLEFAKKYNIKLCGNFEKEAFHFFAKSAVSFNGSIAWIGAGFEGNYTKKVTKILAIFIRCVKLNPLILLHPKTYLIVFGSILLPKPVIMNVASFYLKIQ
ncbi:MAG: glycosyltransferase family 2 protein [Patescibacteria group bacterium]